MAETTFNVAKGRVIELHKRVKDNILATAGLVIVLLKTTQTLALLKDHETVAAILAAAANTEADFVNYSRIVLTDADIAPPNINHTTDLQEVSLPAISWIPAGDGAAGDNDLVTCIVCFVEDVATVNTDSTLIPMTAHDIVVTTNGNNLNLDTDVYHQAIEPA